jgi:tetratricopeptide (TPR) repeat protein
VRTRGFIGLAALLIGVVGAIGATYSGWQRRHGAALDAALGRALESREPAAIDSLVYRGAKPLSPKEGEALLLLAANSGRVSTTERLLSRGAMIGAKPSRRQGETETLEDAEILEWNDAGRTLAQAARRLEPRAEGWVASGRYQLRGERYALAADALRRASTLSRSDVSVAAEYGQARDHATVAHNLQAQLPSGKSIVAVRPLPDASTPGEWLALEATCAHGQSEVEYTNVRLLLVRRQVKAYQILWRSPLLDLADTPIGRFCALALRVDDLFGRGQPEILVSERGTGFGRSPTALQLFRPDGERLARELVLDSAEELELAELGRDGRRQIRRTFEIGWGAYTGRMSHAEQPRWQSLWGWDGRRFRVVDADYPAAFREWPHELSTVLQEYPDDPELLEYLGYAEQILGHSDRARRHYEEALSAIGKALRTERDADLRTALQELQRRVRHRLMLEAKVGKVEELARYRGSRSSRDAAIGGD